MKARRFRNFVKKSEMLIHVRSGKYLPQTIGREERYHGSLKLEPRYRVLPNNRAELIEAVKNYRQVYNYERLHMSLGYRTGCGVLRQGRPKTLTHQPARVPKFGTGQVGVFTPGTYGESFSSSNQKK